jgi:hypothetical protein
MMWSRLQFFVFIQGGVLSGAYAMRGTPFVANGLLGLGVFLSLLVLFMFNRDEMIRDANRELLERCGRALSPHFPDLPDHPFRLSVDTAWPAPFSASKIARLAFLLFIAIDLGVMAIVTLEAF